MSSGTSTSTSSTSSTGISTAANSAAGGSASAGALLAADAAACASRCYEVQQLAARLAACADRTDAVLAQLVRTELQSWESPAGRAYRTSLSLQAATLSRSRMALQEAVAAVLRHAQFVAVSPGRPDY